MRARIAFSFLTIIAVASTAAVGLAHLFAASAWGGVLGVATGLLIGCAWILVGHWRTLALLEPIERGLARLTRGDYSATVDAAGGGALSGIAREFNALGALLREERVFAEQSEQILRMLINEAPMAIVLLEDAGEIEYANDSARSLFFEGRALERANFLALLGDAPAPFREAVLDVQDRLFTVEGLAGAETYHLAKRHFDFRGKHHTLLLVKHLTRELRRQEIDVWKKIIRVLSHELNNSLAPIQSLVHSARLLTRCEAGTKLDRVFSTVEERASHLASFVEGYARFARLPNPRRERVSIASFLQNLEALAPYARVAGSGDVGFFDRSQIEQVVINLLKNAEEAGGAGEAGGAITLEVYADSDGGVVLTVADRGPGMSPEVLENALLPFFSTKERGSGLGLALCREIVEAHGGRIRIENRDGGGVLVTCTLPGFVRVEPEAQARLTLSRV